MDWYSIPYVNCNRFTYEHSKICMNQHESMEQMDSMFMKITLPYMLFVTGPYLLTQFTGNLNNFNVIFLLTKGAPLSVNLGNKAGYTDLLITWLYKMTVDDTNYKLAAVIGIIVFLVTAIISLIVYGILPSVKDEEGFQ